MKCPKCSLVNPDGAERCDCGYDLISGKVQESYVNDDSLHKNKTFKESIYLKQCKIMRYELSKDRNEYIDLLSSRFELQTLLNINSNGFSYEKYSMKMHSLPPIIKGEFIQDNRKLFLEIQFYKPSPILFLLSFIPVLILIIASMVKQKAFHPFLIIFFIVIMAFGVIKYIQYNKLLAEIEEVLDLQKQK